MGDVAKLDSLIYAVSTLPIFKMGFFSIELHLLIKIYTHIMLSGASSERFEVAFPLITSTNF